MNKLNSANQTFILFIVLSALAGLFEYNHYLQQYDVLKKQTEYIHGLESDRLTQYLKNYFDVLTNHKTELEEEDHFIEEKYLRLAKAFIELFPDTRAFNFINSEGVIKNVFPYNGNEAALNKDLKEHPDPVIRNLFQNNISKVVPTYVPPVNIFQGGSAVIFYVPITFSPKTSGWVNVVIEAKDLFHHYKKGLSFYNMDFSVTDDLTRRFYIEGPKELQKSKHTIKFTSKLFNRNLTYTFDLQNQVLFIKKQGLKTALFFEMTIFILCLIFFRYSKNRQKLYSQYLNIKNESNLLRTLIHDLSNPVQVVYMGLQNFKHTDEKNPDLVDMLIKYQKTTVEVLQTVRDIFAGQLILSDGKIVNMKTLVEEVIENSRENLEDSQLQVDFQTTGIHEIGIHINANAFKNHVLLNIFSNAIKFSSKGSKITITLTPNELLISNHHKILSTDKIEELNKMKPLKSTEDNNAKTSLGLGMFIAKIFCHHANIQFNMKQDQNTGVVTTKLTFPS